MIRSAPQASQRLVLLHHIRAVAALLVVFHHCRNARIGLFSPLSDYVFAAMGVDIFFVLSGFFLIHTLKPDAGAPTLLWRRFLRLAPLYWIATLCFLGTSFFILRQPSPAGSALVQSLLFIPFWNHGHVYPLLAVGWTLPFELIFAALLALGMALRHPLVIAGGGIALLLLTGSLIDSRSAPFGVLTNWRLLEFVAGGGLAIMLKKGWLARAWPLLPLGAVGYFLSDFNPAPFPFRVGLPAVAIVAGALGLEQRRHIPAAPWLETIGDASYALYLFHTILLDMLIQPFSRLPLHGWVQFGCWLTLGLSASVILGLAAHRGIERPLNRWLLPKGE